MVYKAGDTVRIKSINEILKDYKTNPHSLDITLAKYCGEVHKVISCVSLDSEFCTLEDIPGFWPISWLEPAEKPAKVSVGWDISRDLSITDFQYQRIYHHANRTGRTTTEVLRMLVAAGMVLLTEDTTC